MQFSQSLGFPRCLGVKLDEELTMGDQLLLGVFRRRGVGGLGVFFDHPVHLGCLIPQLRSLLLIPPSEPGMIVSQDEILWRSRRAADGGCQHHSAEPSAQPTGAHERHPFCHGDFIR